MSNKFKKQAAQQRQAVPQIDMESAKPVVAPMRGEPANTTVGPTQESAETPVEPVAQRPRITVVDTSETPTNRGFSMYPSRHRQVAKDLAYIEDRHPWEIIEDALEEYVIKHHGKEYRRI